MAGISANDGQASHVRIVRRAHRAAFAGAEVTAICDGLRAQDPSRGVRTIIEDGVRVTADRRLVNSAG
jgi:hypothetical protein